MLDYGERRKSLRGGLRIPIQFKEVQGKDAHIQGALTVNLSEEGARFTTDRFIPLERHMLIETLLPSTSNVVRAVSKVAWIRKMPYCDEYELGVRFISISNQDKTILSNSAKRFPI